MSPPPLITVLCTALLIATVALPPAAAAEPPVLTTVAAAFEHWPELARDDHPVRIKGVVTSVMPSGAFRMHDGDLGIYVSKSDEGRTLTPGDWIELSGFLRRGGFSPWIAPGDITHLGRAPFPIARPATYSMLASGAADNQWLEIEGVIRAVDLPEPRDFVILDIGMAGGTLKILLNYEPGADVRSLVDAAVRVRGVAAVNVNAQKHVVEPSFRVPSLAQIEVLRAGSPDAFSQPLVPLKALMRFSLGALHRHRVRTRGVVTRGLSPTTVFIRDGQLGLKVETTEPHQLHPGDVVEAVGFPAMAEGVAVLQHATYRTIGSAGAPQPFEPALEALLAGAHASDLVRVRARLIDRVRTGQNATLVFQADDHVFKGLLTLTADQFAALPEKDSLVDVTGICAISELEDAWFYRPRSFLLLVATLADIALVQSPPWWTPDRLWRALAMISAILLAAAGWVWALRRQIERKRAVIEQQASHAAALEERSRIARELHDTLEQGLTGLSLQMKAMETDLADAPHPARERLQSARQMLRQSRALARNAIRELRSETLPVHGESLVDGLRRIADSWNASGALTVDVVVQGAVRALPPRLEHHLLGIGTEATTNAVKHGRAGKIHVRLEFRPGEIALRLQDDGVGFDPNQHLEQASGCFGLLGMRERAREVRGDLRIQSRPGFGTEVMVLAPDREEKDALAPTARTLWPASLPEKSPAT